MNSNAISVNHEPQIIETAQMQLKSTSPVGSQKAGLISHVVQDHSSCLYGLKKKEISKLIVGFTIFFAILACISIATVIYALNQDQISYDKSIFPPALSPMKFTQILQGKYFNGDADDPVWLVLLYFLWLVSNGGLGSVTSIGLDEISDKQNPSLSGSHLHPILRIVLGSLFAVVIMLPFGYESFIRLCYQLVTGFAMQPDPGLGGGTAGSISFGQILATIMPFVLGYNTTLVISILNQVTNSAQIFFGLHGADTKQSVSVTESASVIR